MVYVDNDKFYQLLVEYKETASRRSYNEIGKIFLLISEKFLNKPAFINYTPDRKAEMQSDATFLMTRYIKSFNTEFKNPFAYFSQIAYHAFIKYINDQKVRDEIFVSIEKLTSKDSMDSSNGYVVED